MPTKTTTKTPRAAKPETNGESTAPAKRAAKRELTLNELSLRAYKMTYEQLHGKGKKAVRKKADQAAPEALELPEAA